MPHTNLFASSNADLYPRYLSTALEPGRERIYDPDYALIQDWEIYDKVERDAVIQHAMQMRRHLVAGRDWTIAPGGPDEKDKRLAGVIEDLLLLMPGFANSRFNLARAVFMGSSYARIYGKRRPVRANGIVRNWWHPTELRDIDKRRVRLINRDGKVSMELWSVKRRTWEKMEHPEWIVRHVYNDDEGSLGYGRGLMQAIYFYYKGKAVSLREGLQGLERWAQGQSLIKIDASAQGLPIETVRDEYLREYEKMRSRHVFVHDSRDEVSLVDGPSQGWQIVKEMLSYFDTKITVLVLGSNLPTTATSGGSFAMAEVQENSTETLVQYDRSILAESINRDLIGLILSLNAPQFRELGLSDAAKPEFLIQQEKRSDPVQAAQVAQIALNSGIPLRKDEVYEKLGYTIPAPDDEVIETIQPAAPSAPLGELFHA